MFASSYDDIREFFEQHREFVREDGPIKPYEFERLQIGGHRAILGGTAMRLRGFIEGFNAKGVRQ